MTRILLSFLPNKIFKASRVRESRLSDYWPFLNFVSTFLFLTDKPTIKAFKLPCFAQAKVPLVHIQQALSLAQHETGTNFSQHSANCKALRTQPKLVQENLLKLRNLVNGKL